MAVFIPIETPSLATTRHFSAKETDIQVYDVSTKGDSGDFCTCIKQCVPDLPAFTDEIGDDYYKNDKFSLFINTITGGSIVATLQKKGADDIILTDDTYGTYTYEASSKYFLFTIDWYKVWDNSGYGSYTLKVENLNGSGDVVKSVSSPRFKLKKFSNRAANNTVRIETQQYGILKHGNKYISQDPDLASGLKLVNQQIRFYGSLTLTGQTIENSSLQLNNNERSQIQIKDQLYPEYTLTLNLVGSNQVNFVLLDYLFANDVRVSDYNVFNFVFNPEQPTASYYRSIPLKRSTTDFAASRTKLRKTFNIPMEYNNKNIFKINK